MSQHILFNPKIQLILADVDETIADIYRLANSEMILELNKLLEEKRVLFLVSGGGLQSIRERITDLLKPELRHRVIIAHCSGAEVWGFQRNGNLNDKPYYGIYDECLTNSQKEEWRKIMNDTIRTFHLKTFHTQPKTEFIALTKGDTLAVMLADRGPQITLEFVNSFHLSIAQKEILEKELNITIPLFHDAYDLRIPVLEYLKKKISQALVEDEMLPLISIRTRK